jgi:hypothetical protein
MKAKIKFKGKILSEKERFEEKNSTNKTYREKEREIKHGIFAMGIHYNFVNCHS